MQSVWRQAVQLDTRLAQPEVGRKALSPFVTAAGHPWLVAPLPLIRLIEMVGVAIAATDLAAGPENVVALLSRRLVARPDVVGLLDAHPGLASQLCIVADDAAPALRLCDLGPFRLAEVMAAAEASNPLAALAAGRANGEDIVYAWLARKAGLACVGLGRSYRPLHPPLPRHVGRLAAAVFEHGGDRLLVAAPPLEGLAERLSILGRGNGAGSATAISTPRRLERRLRASLAADVEASTTSQLHRLMPRLSARLCPSLLQALLIPIIPAMTLLGLLFDLRPPLLLTFVLSAIAFLGLAMLKLEAFENAGRLEAAAAPIADADLPVYSVLVAVYREAHMMSQLVAALDRLDYPRRRLDIMILTEADDPDTTAAAEREMQGLAHMRTLVVPPGQPRTKPRALCYGLAFAKGELVTVYDAEDRPAPDQLRRAAAALLAGPDHLACVQARLEIAGAGGWLERQFAIEYACLFSGVLPWLARAALPLPLGGTSNHFKRHALEVAGGWDPYNVTEDADLGVRLARFGFTTGMFDSATAENAPRSVPVWLRQRRRWIKGWLVTWFVHMRRPRRLYADLGIWNLVAFQLHLAANALAPLAHPVWLAMLTAYGFGWLSPPDELSFADTLLIVAAMLGMLAGYGGNFLVGWRVLGLIGRPELRRDLWLQPFYWLLSSWAAWRALWEIVRHPHFWDKTPHETVAAPAPVTPDRACRPAPPRSSPPSP